MTGDESRGAAGPTAGDAEGRTAGEVRGRAERVGVTELPDAAARSDAVGQVGRGWFRRPGRPAEVLLPEARWRRWVLIAPGLAVLGFVLLVATAVLDDRHGKRASALCHQLPVPWALFVGAWASLVCGVAAMAVCALFFRAARRAGRHGAECWQGTAAVCICVADVLVVIFQAVAVYGVHAEAGEAYWSCAGAGARALSAVLGG
ncbi:hypothetical protein SAMN05216267_103236 [Actinacidiphila rubida]|uniref:Uncharacterized protein n=1 Tax=Actinacidiphila rubida TaxID=310780 RepID=A0A1H8R107_9ACTN|nr:hypothetical protein [Actinacidiphila rubida]SEO59808.1 hypothetical protein SAMN05216267_103236 [Actinacidiphila rubida]